MRSVWVLLFQRGLCHAATLPHAPFGNLGTTSMNNSCPTFLELLGRAGEGEHGVEQDVGAGE